MRRMLTACLASALLLALTGRVEAAKKQAGFTLTSSGPVTMRVNGPAVTLTVTVTPDHGFKGPVTLTMAGLPPGVQAVFSPATVTGNAVVSMRLRSK